MFVSVALKECLIFVIADQGMLLCTDQGRFNVCDRWSRKV